MEQRQHANKELRVEANVKQHWVAPVVVPLNTDAIKQQEDELLELLLSDPDGFRLLSGSLTTGG